MDRKNPGGDRTDLYHLFVKTSRQEKKRGRAGLILRSFWDKNEIFHRVYIIDFYIAHALLSPFLKFHTTTESKK